MKFPGALSPESRDLVEHTMHDATRGALSINSGIQIRSVSVLNSHEVSGYQVNRGDWNTYRILGEGRRIRTWINGLAALDYTEEDETIPQSGHIGIQIHEGGKALAQIRDIRIKVLPCETGLPGWPNKESPCP